MSTDFGKVIGLVTGSYIYNFILGNCSAIACEVYPFPDPKSNILLMFLFFKISDTTTGISCPLPNADLLCSCFSCSKYSFE